MKTIVNLSQVTDYSGRVAVTTYSNAVTTVVNQTGQTIFVPRMAPCPPCNCCCICCCQRQCNGRCGD
ncbi:MAG: hypothetical protein OSJ74_02395 [Clostridia bacterium]|nr:hypothetical protein [Clostridia bacterium]